LIKRSLPSSLAYMVRRSASFNGSSWCAEVMEEPAIAKRYVSLAFIFLLNFIRCMLLSHISWITRGFCLWGLVNKNVFDAHINNLPVGLFAEEVSRLITT